MFWTIVILLGLIWMLGLLSGYTLGGAVHLLLVCAVAMGLYGIYQGWRRPA